MRLFRIQGKISVKKNLFEGRMNPPRCIRETHIEKGRMRTEGSRHWKSVRSREERWKNETAEKMRKRKKRREKRAEDEEKERELQRTERRIASGLCLAYWRVPLSLTYAKYAGKSMPAPTPFLSSIILTIIPLIFASFQRNRDSIVFKYSNFDGEPLSKT